MKKTIHQEKRELRLKIGRMRRRIDARLRATGVEGRKLVAWRTYVVRYPAASVLAAFGLGMSGVSLFRPRRLFRLIGASLLRGSADRAMNLTWKVVRRYWESAGEKS